MIPQAGLPLVREKSRKFKVRGKSGNFQKSQGKVQFWKKSVKLGIGQGYFEVLDSDFVHAHDAMRFGGPRMWFMYHLWDTLFGVLQIDMNFKWMSYLNMLVFCLFKKSRAGSHGLCWKVLFYGLENFYQVIEKSVNFDIFHKWKPSVLSSIRIVVFG